MHGATSKEIRHLLEQRDKKRIRALEYYHTHKKLKGTKQPGWPKGKKRNIENKEDQG